MSLMNINIVDTGWYDFRIGISHASHNSATMSQLLTDSPVKAIILMKPGTYHFSNPIVLGQRSLVNQFSTDSSTLKLISTSTSSSDFIQVNQSTKATLEHFTIELPSTSNAGSALSILDSHQVTVTDVAVKRHTEFGYGISVIAQNDYCEGHLFDQVTIENSYSTTNGSYGLVLMTTGLSGGIDPIVVKNIKFDRCKVYGYNTSIIAETIGEGISFNHCEANGGSLGEGTGIKVNSPTTIVPLYWTAGSIVNHQYGADGIVMLNDSKTHLECINGARGLAIGSDDLSVKSYGLSQSPYNKGVSLLPNSTGSNDHINSYGRLMVGNNTLVDIIGLPIAHNRYVNGLLSLTIQPNLSNAGTQGFMGLYHLSGRSTAYLLTPLSTRLHGDSFNPAITVSGNNIQLIQSSGQDALVTWQFIGQTPKGFRYQ